MVFAWLAEGEVALPGRLAERYNMLVDDSFDWAELVMDPVVSLAEVRQARYEVAALCIAGFVHVSGKVVTVCTLQEDGPDLASRFAALQLLDPSVDLEAFVACIPKGAAGTASAVSVANAQPLVQLLHRASTAEVPAEDVQACQDPFETSADSTQAQRLGADPALAQSCSQEAANKKRRLGADLLLTDENLTLYVAMLVLVTKFVLLSARPEIPAHEFGRKCGAGAAAVPERQASVLFAFKLLETVGLGRAGGRGGTFATLRPPDDAMVDKEAKRFATLLHIDEKKVKDRLSARPANQAYDASTADEWFHFMSPKVGEFLRPEVAPLLRPPAAAGAGAESVAAGDGVA